MNNIFEDKLVLPSEVLENLVTKEQQYRLLGRLKKPKNTLFEFDPAELTLRKADYTESSTKGFNDKLIIKSGRIYVDALNIANAKRKILQRKILFHTM